jgi:hypothetical protein
MLLLYARKTWIAQMELLSLAGGTIPAMLYTTMMMVDPVLEILLQVECLEEVSVP